MPTLGNIAGGSLAPDVGPGLAGFRQALGVIGQQRAQEAEREREAARQAKIDAEIRELVPDPNADPETDKTANQAALLRLNALDPNIGRAVLEVISSGDEQERETFRREAEKGAKNAAFISGQPDFVSKQRALVSLATEAATRGEPLDRLIELQNMNEVDLDLELQRMSIAGQDIQDVLAVKTLSPRDLAFANLTSEEQRALTLEPLQQSKGTVTTKPVLNTDTGRLEFASNEDIATSDNLVPPPAARPAGQPTTKKVRDTGTGKDVFATEADIAAAGGRLVPPPAAGAKKIGKAFLLPDDTSVLSFDGGQTYTNAAGETVNIPFNATPLGPESAVKEVRAAKQRAAAQKRLNAAIPGLGAADTPNAIDSAAELGTGPWSNVLAAADAVIGGVLNIKTMFPQTQDNRQHLRLIKQTGKAALLNSARGPIWEQQKIDELFPDPDKFWANPDAEARKVPEMIRTLNELQRLNDEIISEGALGPEELTKRVTSNLDIRRTLALLGTGRVAGGGVGGTGRSATAAPRPLTSGVEGLSDQELRRQLGLVE